VRWRRIGDEFAGWSLLFFSLEFFGLACAP
jgi:hypothetical protein